MGNAESIGKPSGAHIAEEFLQRGNPMLAGRMGSIPELSVFRRFGALNSQRLLYLQAELIHLERQLRGREQTDDGSNKDYSVDWAKLRNSATCPDECNLQYELMNKIWDKLREYSRHTSHLPYCNAISNICRSR